MRCVQNWACGCWGYSAECSRHLAIIMRVISPLLTSQMPFLMVVCGFYLTVCGHFPQIYFYIRLSTEPYVIWWSLKIVRVPSVSPEIGIKVIVPHGATSLLMSVVDKNFSDTTPDGLPGAVAPRGVFFSARTWKGPMRSLLSAGWNQARGMQAHFPLQLGVENGTLSGTTATNDSSDWQGATSFDCTDWSVFCSNLKQKASTPASLQAICSFAGQISLHR